MLPFQFREWTASDLDNLISAKPAENRQIEYKSELPKQPGESKGKPADLEFLEDASAFANAAGGVIIFGIREENGEPVEICGLGSADLDAEKRRLSQLLDANLDPVFRTYEFDIVTASNGNRVLILRLAQSPNYPHMITKGTKNFYTRGAAGKVPMDAADVRNAFLSAGAVEERINAFVDQRLEIVASKKGALPLANKGNAILHILPVSAFQRPIRFPMDELKKQHDFLRPMSTSGWDDHVLLEGYAQGGGDENGEIYTYALLFRDGCIEATCNCANRPTDKYPKGLFNEGHVIDQIFDHMPGYEKALEGLGIYPPFFMSISVLNCSGMTVWVDPSRPFRKRLRPIDNDIFRLPIVEFGGASGTWQNAVREVFELFANYTGRPHHPMFNEDGTLRSK